MDKGKALQALCPNAEWAIVDDVVTWLDTTQTQPTDGEINAKITELQNAEPMRLLRVERDKKLAETDYWMFSDTTTATQAQLDYRQALRDITNTYTSLDTVVWPTKP